MREVLRQEFGDLAPLARRSPRPSVAATSDIWLAVAAVGTAWLVSTLGGFAFSLLWQAMHPSDVPQGASTVSRSIVSVAATAAAVAVARSGGLRPLVVYVTYAAVIAALGVIRSFVVAPLLRERGFPADLVDPSSALLGHWTSLAGLVIGLVLARYIATRRDVATNAFLEAAGARVAVPATAFALIGIAAPLADERFLGLSIATLLAGSIAAGMVIAVRAQSVLRTALLLGGLATVTWVWPLGFSQVQLAIEAGHEVASILVVAMPAGEAALIVLTALVVSAARRMRRSLSG